MLFCVENPLFCMSKPVTRREKGRMCVIKPANPYASNLDASRFPSSIFV
jgi:hypothetical protein